MLFRKVIVALAVAALCSGCAGLNVSWSVNASYNSNMQVTSGTAHQTSPVGGKDEK